MIILLTGGSASGKSDWAEALAAALHKRKKKEDPESPLLYLATMNSPDRESRRRVARHRARRANKGFTATLERPTALAELNLPENAALLLEDLGNLAANEFFAPDGGGEKALFAGLEHLFTCAAHLVLVGNSVFSDGERWTGSMAEYTGLLAKAQALCAARADAAGEVVCGIPLWHKRPAGEEFRQLLEEARPLIPEE